MAVCKPFEPAAVTPVPLPLRKETDSFTATDAPAFVAEAPVLLPQPTTPAAPLKRETARGTEGNTPVETPAADLSGTLQSAGLVMIETSSKKKAISSDSTPEEPARRGRKPRPSVVIADEPLQQVETQKDA